MTIISLIVLKEMFEMNCKCQEKCHMKKKEKAILLQVPGDSTANKSAGAARMMVCGSVIKYSNVVRVREETG